MMRIIALIIALICIAVPENVLASSEAGLAPVSVERKNIDGTEYIIKVYETPPLSEFSADTDDFEMDGFIFSHLTTDKKINEISDTKEVSEEVKQESQSKNLEDIIKLFSPTKPYEQEEYKGTLTLDIGSIVTEAAGYTTKNYTVSTVKEYPGLMYADPSYVSQTAVKDGYTLPLTDISWVVTGSGLSGDSLVPTEYKATATYSKTFSSQIPTGYISTARYTGTVEKTMAETAVYTVTYVGMPLKANEEKPVAFVSAAKWLALVLIFAGGTLFIIFIVKSKRGADIYNMADKEYVCIGHQMINPKEPVIDLNEFDDMIQSNAFQFVLDKRTAKAIFGRNIAVTLKDVTVKHRVNGRNGEYKFELDLGGVLDAE